MQRHWGGRDMKCEDMKTRPVWLELVEGGVERVYMRSQKWAGALGAGEWGRSWSFIWVTRSPCNIL